VNVCCLVSRKLVGTNDDAVGAIKRTEIACFDLGIVRFRFYDCASNEELLIQFLMPLLPKVRGRDSENVPIPLSPSLRNDQPGLCGFAKADLIGQ
jgi:hypothetical protein